MCKWLRDILFPTNVLGKKKQCAKFVLPSGYNSVPLNIEFEGDILDISYTRIWLPPKKFPNGEQIQQSIAVSGTHTVTIVRANRFGQRVGCSTAYFNCTNVTKLIVNGEQLI